MIRLLLVLLALTITASAQTPLPKGTTSIPVEDQINGEEDDPGAAIPS